MDWNEEYERNKPDQKPVLLDIKKVTADTDLLDDCNMQNFDQLNSYQFVADAMKKVQQSANQEDMLMEDYSNIHDLSKGLQQIG